MIEAVEVGLAMVVGFAVGASCNFLSFWICLKVIRLSLLLFQKPLARSPGRHAWASAAEKVEPLPKQGGRAEDD